MNFQRYIGYIDHDDQSFTFLSAMASFARYIASRQIAFARIHVTILRGDHQEERTYLESRANLVPITPLRDKNVVSRFTNYELASVARCYCCMLL